MKKRLLLLASLCCFLIVIHAQTTSIAPAANNTFFNGHLIRLFKTAYGGYGYDIFYQSRLVVHQSKNPFTKTEIGLKTPEDALKLAKWQVLHLNPARQSELPDKTIPRQVAVQLNIDTN
jgi:hypothetical protein